MAVNKAQENQWTGVQNYNEANVKMVPIKAGLYCLLYKIKDKNSYHAFYIGQADDLNRRLTEHMADSEKNNCIKNNVKKYVCGFQYLFVPRQADRDRLEPQYIAHYKPGCNVQHN